MSDRTRVVAGPFHTREAAQRVERFITRTMERAREQDVKVWVEGVAVAARGSLFVQHSDGSWVIPPWAEGVRVERAGLRRGRLRALQFVVVATERRER